MDRLLSMRVFRRVVDEGGFAAAARALDMSPAVVTRLVADLESHLGTRLLQRTTRRLSVTDAGAAYAERVRLILDDIDDADESVGAETRELAGTLRVSTPPVLANHVVGPLIASFRHRHPHIRFEVDVDPAGAPQVETHDITLIATDEGFDRGLVARRILTVEAVLVAAPSYLTRRGEPRRPQDLSAHDCLRLRLPGLRPNVWPLKRRTRDHDEIVDVPVQTVLWTNDNDLLVRAAVDGAGITATTLEIAAQHLTRGELVRVLDPWVVGRPSIYAALPSRKFVPRRVQAFLDHMTTEIQHTLADLDRPKARRSAGRSA